MSVLGPFEVLLIAVIAFHLVLVSRLGWRGYLWLRVVASAIVAQYPVWLLRLAAVGLCAEAICSFALKDRNRDETKCRV